MDNYEAHQIINDSKMRQALWEWLYAHHPDVEKGRPTFTPPSDERILEDLQRILIPKRKRFLGLF